MNKTFIILSICIMASLTGCSQQGKQPKVFGESPLNLENFDFNLNIKTFIPEKYLQEYGWYHIPANGGKVMVVRDTIYWEHINDRLFVEKTPENAKWLLFSDRGNTTDDYLAKYGEFPFLHIQFAVSLDNEIMAVHTQTPEWDKDTNDNFVQLLTSKYAHYQSETGERLFSKYEKYTWKLNDRIIYYWAYHNEDETQYQGSFYIYKKEFADKISNVFENE